MKNIKYALMLAAVLSVVSCTKEIENGKPVLGDDADKGNLIINAVAGSLGKPEADTKAHGEFCYDVVWDTDDQIAVINGSNNQGLFNLIDGVGETLGKFEQAGGTVLSGEVTGYYPAAMLQKDGSIVWPTEQKYTTSMTGIPMTATATIEDGGTEFRFKSIGSVMQLVLTSQEGDLMMKSITVSADNMDTPISLDCQGLTIGASAKTVNIAIPADTYTSMHLRFETVDGYVRTMTSPSITMNRAVVEKITLALSGFEREFPDYLSFTATGCDVPVGMKGVSSPDSAYELEYTLDPVAGTWTTFTTDPGVSDVQNILTLGEGQTVFLRGKSYRLAIGASQVKTWRFDFGNAASNGGRIIAKGNVMSLLDPLVKSNIAGDYAFIDLFNGAAALATAPELPATKLGIYCYANMFKGCTNLTEAPELPAVVLAESCYQGMFCNTGLKATAEMYASDMDRFCCYEMYMSCKSLVSVRPLNSMNLAEGCYLSMFEYCSKLTEAPELPAINMEESCYSAMFAGCPSLVKAPELPATTLAPGCYCLMFLDCTSLETAPHLPATTLAGTCYYRLFKGCTSLKTISAAFTEWDDENNGTLDWVSDVASNGTFYCPVELEDIRGIDNIPSGWTVARNSLPDDVKIGTLVMLDGIEGIYVGIGSDGKKLVFATKNYGADSKFDAGYAYDGNSISQLINAKVWGSNWKIPTEDDMNFLATNFDFYDDFGQGTSASIGGYYYYIPYTRTDTGNIDECGLWLAKGTQYTDYFFFRANNTYGKLTDSASLNNIRLVQKF